MQLGGPSRFRGGLPTRSTARLFTDKQGKDEVPHFELRPYRDKGEQHVSGLLHYYDTAIDLKNKGCSSEAFLSSSCLSLADRCFCPSLKLTPEQKRHLSHVSVWRGDASSFVKKVLFCNCVYKWSKSALCVFNYCKESVEDWSPAAAVCVRISVLLQVWTGSEDVKGQVSWYQVTLGLIPLTYITPSLSLSPTQESKLDPHHLYLYWTKSYISCHTASIWFITYIYL